MKKEGKHPSKAGSLRRKGALLVTGAMMLTGLFGILAIATDVGYFLYLKRRIQAATDASVMAGVQGFRRSDCGDPESSDCKDLVKEYALEGSERNGFKDGIKNITVTVNQPPASGPYSANPLVVEVITCQLHPTFFMPIMGAYEATACARASAGLLGEGGGCIYALNRTEPKSLHVHSEAVLDANCEIIINSDDDFGLTVDSGACMRGASIHVTAEDFDDDVCKFGENDNPPPYSGTSIEPPPYVNVPPTLDPLAHLPEPEPPPGCDFGGFNSFEVTSDTTLDPETDAATPGHLTICKGIEVKNDAVLTLLPGIYYITTVRLTIHGRAATDCSSMA